MNDKKTDQDSAFDAQFGKHRRVRIKTLGSVIVVATCATLILAPAAIYVVMTFGAPAPTERGGANDPLD